MAICMTTLCLTAILHIAGHLALMHNHSETKVVVPEPECLVSVVEAVDSVMVGVLL